jgi:ABC-type Fe3+-hydroxamate transport system substrate-binding protein
MPVYTDQLGNTVKLPSFPTRIVSLVPSLTELLYHLGLGDRVVGITKFCVHPDEWFNSKTRIGGTKTVKLEVIGRLQPDLVLANKEENIKDQVVELSRHYPVWTSDVHHLASALDMIREVGIITGTSQQAANIITRIQSGFAQLQTSNIKPQTAYLIWRNPWMTIGGDTFIHDMLDRCGLQNIFSDATRYPEVSIEMLRNKNCRLLLLSSEPYPFKEVHIAELQEQLPGTKILLVDGEMFSWYGSRLMEAPAYFESMLKKFEV